MGLLDKFNKVLRGNKPAAAETIKGPSRVLRDNGIDPSALDFTFGQDGSITVSGEASDQAECDRISELLKDMPNVSGVQNNISVNAPKPETPEPDAQAGVGETTTTQAGNAGRTYTVQSGDTLWKIADKMYGNGSRYMQIFEANTSLLENPDKIFPGQELVIPELEE